MSEPSFISFGIDKKDKTFINFITQIDKLNINNIHQNGSKWFNRELPLSAIDSLYNTPLNISKNQFVFSTKFNPDDQQLINGIYNSYKENVNLSDIRKNDKVRIIFLYYGIKIFKGRAIPLFEIKQIKHICGKPKSYQNISQYIIKHDVNSGNQFEPIIDDDSDIEIEIDNNEYENEEINENENKEINEDENKEINENEEINEKDTNLEINANDEINLANENTNESNTDEKNNEELNEENNSEEKTKLINSESEENNKNLDFFNENTKEEHTEENNSLNENLDNNDSLEKNNNDEVIFEEESREISKDETLEDFPDANNVSLENDVNTKGEVFLINYKSFSIFLNLW